MWAATSASPSPSCLRLPISTRRPPTPPALAVYAKSQPPRTDAEKTAPDNDSSVKSLGHTILSAVKSTNPKSPHSNRKQRSPKQKSEVEATAAAGQISGSDVLRALQKAAAVKEQNRNRQVKDKKKEGPSTEGSDTDHSGMNRRVRPLRIKSDWGLRLSELEKRLQEISETIYLYHLNHLLRSVVEEGDTSPPWLSV